MASVPRIKSGTLDLYTYLTPLKYMGVISNLRPVEALYLLDSARKESMDEKNSLAAALVYLGSEGYITPRNEEFVLTEKGRQRDPNLRIYEKDVLDCFAKDYPEGLVDVINEYDFRGDMTQRGFFRTQQQKRGWWIFKWMHTDYLPTGQFDQAIRELDDLRYQIDAASRKRKSLDKNLVTMAYAFPSLALSDGFKRYASEVLNEVEATQIAVQSAVIAAIILPSITSTTITTSGS